MRVMVIGASRDKSKYGNKAVRAYQQKGHEVLPVNPNADEIEGARAYADIASVPGPIDRATVYLPEDAGRNAMDELAERGDVQEVFLNPGADEDSVVGQAKRKGLNVRTACSIVDIGVSPDQL